VSTNTDHKGQWLRAVVLDVDGTLLDPAHRITPAMTAAIERARAAGLHVLLASGRSATSMLGVLAELGLDGPAVAFNGALTFRVRDGELVPLAETPLALDAAAETYALARERGIEVGWFTREGWRAAARGPGIAEEQALTGEPPLVDPSLPDGAPAPLKLMCIVPGLDEAPALHALREALPATARGLFSHQRYLEVTAPGIDKARGLEVACAALGIVPSELAAIGDAENDIGMLRWAGVGIAMGNATPLVMAAADRVTGTNAAGGAAAAIDALLGVSSRERRPAG
jgi:Cof subfamily protein (haloacid dehalogenase superfamily)